MQFQEKVSILERKLVDKDIANGMPTGGGKKEKNQEYKVVFIFVYFDFLRQLRLQLFEAIS